MSETLPPGQPGQPQGTRLTEEEAKTVARLLSDPTYFPVEFRAWIKSFIESSGITLPASQIKGGGTGARTGLPAGILIAYPASALPPDALACDGRAIGRSDFPKLFEIVGVVWGAGDGSTTFNIPDLRDRALYGVGGAVGLAATDGRALGQRGGPNHHHYFDQYTDNAGYHGHGMDNAGWHSHYYDRAYGVALNIQNAADGPANVVGITGGDTGGEGEHSHGINGDGEHAHSVDGDTSGGFDQDRPSFAGVVWAITTGL